MRSLADRNTRRTWTLAALVIWTAVGSDSALSAQDCDLDRLLAHLALNDTIVLRLVGPEYEDLTSVQVVQGDRRIRVQREIVARLGPYTDGARDLTISASHRAHPVPDPVWTVSITLDGIIRIRKDYSDDSIEVVESVLRCLHTVGVVHLGKGAGLGAPAVPVESVGTVEQLQAVRFSRVPIIQPSTYGPVPVVEAEDREIVLGVLRNAEIIPGVIREEQVVVERVAVQPEDVFLRQSVELVVNVRGHVQLSRVLRNTRRGLLYFGKLCKVGVVVVRQELLVAQGIPNPDISITSVVVEVGRVSVGIEFRVS